MQVTIVDGWRLKCTGSILGTFFFTVAGKERRWSESQPLLLSVARPVCHPADVEMLSGLTLLTVLVTNGVFRIPQ